MNTENKATLEASDRAALNCSIGMSLGDDLIVGEQIEFSDFLKEVRSSYNPESISDNSFLFVQKRVDNLMYYAWCFKEVYDFQVPCLLVCYNSIMLSPASLESVSKKIARQWYNIVNISDNRAVVVEQMKKLGVVEQILQQQEYTYLPTYDYSTKPTTTSLETFSTNKIEKAAQTNSRICILWTEPQIETKTFTVKGVEFKMIKVEGGTFDMGKTSEQSNDNNDEKLVHSVTLSDYYIGETEVTQELWKAVMGNNPSAFTNNKQCPVESVSWNDCQAFIKKLYQLSGKKFRLPTEAEWEYAARGGKYSRVYKYSGSNNPDEVAWYWQNSGYETHPVATKKANELGLYDMSGNVWEWCSDGNEDYRRQSQTNSEMQSNDKEHVMRGGSWGSSVGRVRVSDCVSYFSNDSDFSSGGLRLVLETSQSKQDNTISNSIAPAPIWIFLVVFFVIGMTISLVFDQSYSRTETDTKTEIEEPAIVETVTTEEAEETQKEVQQRQNKEKVRQQTEGTNLGEMTRERVANFNRNKSFGDFYFNEYFENGDYQARQKAKYYYGEALQYLEDSAVRKRYNSL